MASDSSCPNQNFFLKCAYLIVGDAVRTNYHTESRERITKFIEQAVNTRNNYLLEFAEHSKNLMSNPSSFDYDQWCDGGLAYAQFKS